MSRRYMQRIKHTIHRTYELGKVNIARAKRHPVALPLALFGVLVLITGIILLFGLTHNAKQLTVVPNQNHIVLVKVDGAEQTVPTNAKDVGELLGKLDIKLAPNDRVEPGMSEKITQDKFRVNIYRAVPVHVVDGQNVHNALTGAATARGMVERAGVNLYPEDVVTLTVPDNLVKKPVVGLLAVVTRATPVTMTLYGGPPIATRTQAKTVAEFIKEKKIVVTDKDTVKPALDYARCSGHADRRGA